MTPNMGTTDRIVRALVGIALIAVFVLDLVAGLLGIAGAAIGVVLLVTAAIRWCPPYALLGINTRGRDESAAS